MRITTDPAEDVEPSFSPDGSRIVFVRRETGGIYVVDTLGGEARCVVAARRAHNPRFSPDGRWIAYWTGLPVAISRAAGASGSLFVVAASGGEPRGLLTGFANARHPIWSIDGQRLLFVGERSAGDRGSTGT